jgi:uncharacterized repeat protein (TIGR03803 family)
LTLTRRDLLRIGLCSWPLAFVFFIGFVAFVIVGSSNAVNLTDGLDGLAIGCTVIAAGALTVLTYVSGHATFATYLEIPRMPQVGGPDGGEPLSAVVLDSAGNLYGTTQIGGTAAKCGNGCGVVFELTPSSTVPWNEAVIYAFPALSTGAYPQSALTFDQTGNLYGTTNGGGNAPNQFCNQGCGTVFKLTPSSAGWQETALYNFTGPLSDGAAPVAGVILDSAQNIYGTTRAGGINGYDYQYGGTVFKITQ